MNNHIAKLTKVFEDPEKSKAFAVNFVQGFTTPAFGAISKTEMDSLVFALLIEAGAINPESQVFEIARDLKVTPAKARNLLFQWQLRGDDQHRLQEELESALRHVRFTKDGGKIEFGVESPLLREELRSAVKRQGVYPDASFSPELVRVPVEQFADALDSLVDEGSKKAIVDALAEDGTLKAKTFGAIARRLLTDLVKAQVGDAAGEAVQGLVSGNFQLVKKFLDWTAKGDDPAKDG